MPAHLVSESMERSGETSHTTGKRQVGVTECRADQVTRVSRYVAALVVTVKAKVQIYRPIIPVNSANFVLFEPRYWNSFFQSHLPGF